VKGVKSYQEGLGVIYMVELDGFGCRVGFVRIADILRLRAEGRERRRKGKGEREQRP